MSNDPFESYEEMLKALERDMAIEDSLDLIVPKIDTLLVLLSGLKEFDQDEEACPFDEQDCEQLGDLSRALYEARTHFKVKYGN